MQVPEGCNSDDPYADGSCTGDPKLLSAAPASPERLSLVLVVSHRADALLTEWNRIYGEDAESDRKGLAIVNADWLYW